MAILAVLAQYWSVRDGWSERYTGNSRFAWTHAIKVQIVPIARTISALINVQDVMSLMFVCVNCWYY